MRRNSPLVHPEPAKMEEEERRELVQSTLAHVAREVSRHARMELEQAEETPAAPQNGSQVLAPSGRWRVPSFQQNCSGKKRYARLDPPKRESEGGDGGGYVNTGLDCNSITEQRESPPAPSSPPYGDSPCGLVQVQRPVLDLPAIERQFGKKVPDTTESCGEKIKSKVCKPLATCCQLGFLGKLFVSLFPVVEWLPQYKVKEWLASDVIAGFTIAILHIPQGMAYGLLASVDAINGLYVSFFPILIYFLMGTSRHVSIGTFAIISMMVATAADSVLPPEFPNYSEAHTTTLTPGLNSTGPPGTEGEELTRIDVLVALALTVGFIQAGMGMLRLGSLAVLLSDHLVSGFSTGAAMHVATSQVNDLLGLGRLPRRSGIFKIIYTWGDILTSLGGVNFAAIIISLVALALLIAVKEFVNPRVQPWLKVPVPIDLLVVILATGVSYFGKFNQNYNLNVMGHIPTGLPAPSPPRLWLMPKLIAHALIIAIVSYAVALSMAKIFSKKHKYPIYPNQELIAMGSANIFSSFFQCYPCAGSLSRSLVQEKSGGKTQVAGIVSCGFLLIVLLFLGPLFYTLPKCILSCVILVALKGMFMQLGDFVKAWQVSKIDAFIWAVTFLSTVLMDVDIGLLVGVVACVLSVAFRTFRPSLVVLGRLPDTELYVDKTHYSSAKEVPGIKIIKFSGGLYFANRDFFKTSIFQLIETPECVTLQDGAVRPDSCTVDLSPGAACCHFTVLDCSSIPYLDVAGVEVLLEVFDACREDGVTVLLAGCSVSLVNMMERTEFFAKVPRSCLFPSVHDAVINAHAKPCSLNVTESPRDRL